MKAKAGDNKQNNMRKVKCEICGKYVPQSDMSKSYRHRCKKCVAELTRQNRHDAKMRLAATKESCTHTADPYIPYGSPVSDILQKICANGADETIRLAIQTYGKDAQTLMLFEEMAELQDAICKHLRGRDKTYHVCEEIADVMIMCLQMTQIYGVKCVEKWVDFKMNRLNEHLKGGKL